MEQASNREIVRRAWEAGRVVPGFNICDPPMMAPVVRALRETRSFGFIMVARPDWTRFEAGGPKRIREEYEQCKDERHTRLHLDHVPAIDEEGQQVDYLPILEEALALGYGSVMVDGSRLPLEENIAATRRAVEVAQRWDAAVEGELGAVLGHESGPLPPYEELFATGQGFTDPEEAARFVAETGADWLSVAIGNVHGAISGAQSRAKKVEARLNIDRLRAIRDAVKAPLVLHGGSGIARGHLAEAFRNGIAKINVATAIRQPYKRALPQGLDAARHAVYETVLGLLRGELEGVGLAEAVL